MIEITNICPMCDKRSILEFEDEDRGDDLPEHDQPWRTICLSCEGLPQYNETNSGSIGIYGFVCDVLFSEEKERQEYGLELLHAEKFEFKENMAQLNGDEFIAFAESKPSLPQENCLFFRRPGKFVHAVQSGDIIRARLAFFDPDSWKMYFCPVQLTYNWQTGEFGAESWLFTGDCELSKETVATVAGELMSFLAVLSDMDVSFEWVKFELENKRLQKKGQVPLFPFYSVRTGAKEEA